MSDFAVQNIAQAVFIDSRTPDIQTLIAGVRPGERAFVLDPSTDGVQKIADTLAAEGLTGLAAIAIVGHGAPGKIHLGSTWLGDGDLACHAAALSAIGAALVPDGGLALYACNTAAGAAGRQFIADLSACSGGVDVAAATHVVGSADLGGSWTLDAATGAIVTAAPFTATALANFHGALAAIGPLNGNFHDVQQGGSAVTLLSSAPTGISISGNSAGLVSATVRMLSGESGDLLGIGSTFGFTTSPQAVDAGGGHFLVSFDAGTYILTVANASGASNTIAQYAAMLAQVSYKDTGTDLSSGKHPARAFLWRLDDGTEHNSDDTAPTLVIIDRAPVATADTNAVTVQAAPVEAEVLSNDVDLDGDSLTVVGFADSSGRAGSFSTEFHGTYGNLYMPHVGQYSYTAGFSADQRTAIAASAPTGSHLEDVFTYTVSDNNGGFASSTLTFTINRQPDAVADANSAVSGGAPVTGNVLSNDTDEDGDTLFVAVLIATSADVGALSHGTYGDFIINADGSYIYAAGATTDQRSALASAGGAATETISYIVGDGYLGGGGSSTLSIAVQSAAGTTAIGALNGTLEQAVQTGTGITLLATTPTGISVSDGSAGLTGATATVSNAQSGDLLGIGSTFTYTTSPQTLNPVSGGSFLVSFDPDTYTLTVANASGASNTVAEYEALLAQVSYKDGGEDTSSGAHPTRTITWQVNDGTAGNPADTTTTTVTIDRAIFTVVDTGSVVRGASTTSSSSVVSNDSDKDGDTITLIGLKGSTGGVSGPAGTLGTPYAGTYGHLTLNSDGSYTYIADNTSTIDAAPSGSHPFDTFLYSVNDGTATTTTQLGITIDRAPVAVADTAAVVVSSSTAGNVASNDTDADGDVLKVSTVNGSAGNLGGSASGTYGNITFLFDGSYVYSSAVNPGQYSAIATAATGSHLTDFINYIVYDGHGGATSSTLAITLDRAPVAVADTNSAISQGAPVTGNVLVNDTDADGDGRTLTGFVDDSIGGALGTLFHGTYGDVTLDVDGSYTYAAGVTQGQRDALATAGGTATEVVNYRIIDGHDASGVGTLSIAVQSAPDTTAIGALNGATLDAQQGGDGLTLLGSTPTGITVSAGSAGLSGATVTVSNAQSGDLLGIGSTFTFTTNPQMLNPAGGGSFLVSFDAATHILTIANASGASNTIAQYEALLAQVSYKDTGIDSSSGSHPTRTIIWQVNDGTAVNSADTNITTVTINRAPVAGADYYDAAVGYFDGMGRAIFANDVDLDGDFLRVESFTDSSGSPHLAGATLRGSYGDFSLGVSGGYRYSAGETAGQRTALNNAPAGSHLKDIFTYTASDNRGGTASSTLAVTIDRRPVALDDANSAVSGGAPVTGNVLSNDTDADGDMLAVGVINNSSVDVGTQSHGTYGDFTLNADGSYIYTAGATAGQRSALTAAGGAATETITYLAGDGYLGVGAAATLSIAVQSADTTAIGTLNGATVYAVQGGDGLTLLRPAPTGITISEGSAGLAGATVAVSNAQSGDLLGIGSTFSYTTTPQAVNPAGGGHFLVSFDEGTHTLTIANASGASNTIAQYEALLAQVSYKDTGTDSSAGSHPTRTIVWQVNDGTAPNSADTTTTTVTIDRVPTLTADSAIATVGNQVSGYVISNDTDLDGDSLSVLGFTDSSGNAAQVFTPIHGTYGDFNFVNTSGYYLYTAGATAGQRAAIANQPTGGHFEEIFTYTAGATDNKGGSASSTLAFTINRKPVGMNDVNSAVAGGASVTGNVLSNDTDPDGDTLELTGSGSFDSAGRLVHGTYGDYAFNADGSYIYTAGVTAGQRSALASAGGTATETITYSVSDGPTGSGARPTLSIAVRSAVDTTAIGTLNGATLDAQQGGDGLTLLGSTPTGITVSDGSAGLAGATVAVSNAQSGDLLGIGSTFNYTTIPQALNPVSGGSFLVSFDAGNHTLTISNASGASNTIAQYEALLATVSYKDTGDDPSSGTHSTRTITWQVNDGTAVNPADTATTTVTINRAPVAMADTDAVIVGGAIVGSLRANDTDLDRDNLSVTSFNGSAVGSASITFHGTYGDVNITSDGTYNFYSAATAGQRTAIANAPTGSHPTELVTYTLSDGRGGTASSTLSITIDRAPVAFADANSAVSGGAPVTGNVLSNDIDVDADILFVGSINDIPGSTGTLLHGTYGDFTLNADGSYTYAAGITAGQRSALSAAGGAATEIIKYRAGDGYVGGGAAATLSIAVQSGDTTAPTVLSVVTTGADITAGSGNLNAGHTVTFTVNLNEAVTIAGGTPTLTLNDGGVATYSGGSGTAALTFTYTVAAGQNTADLAVIASSLNGATAQDSAGNAADLTAAITNPAGTLQIDTTAPVVSSVTTSGTDITAGSGNLNAGHTVTFTVNLSEAVTIAGGTPTLTLNDGGVATYSAGSGTTALTFTYTVAAGQDTADLAVIASSLNGATAQDSAGNAADLTAAITNPAGTLQIDTLAPTVSVTADHTALLAGETAIVTFTFSEAVSGFVIGDTSVSGGSLSGLVHVGLNGSSQDVYTATFTPGSGPASVQVNAASYADAAGNNGAASNTLSFTGDTLAPTVSVAADDTTLQAGQTAVVTFTFSEAVSGFALGDIAVSGGALSNLVHVGLNGSSQDVYTATFTPSAANTEAGSVQVNAASYTDVSGNNGVASNTVSFTGDTLAPTVSVAADHTALLAGDTAVVTFTFSEAVSGFALSDAGVSGGALSNLVHVGLNGSSQDVYTATFTPGAANAEAGSVQVNAASYTDTGGNSGAASNLVSFTGDTLAPTVSVAADHTALLAGDTAVVTFTFSEAISGFALSDVSVSGGALSNLTHVGLNGSSQDVYTATFTPGASTGSLQVNALSYTDAAGNNGAASNTVSFSGDVIAPTVSVAAGDTSLQAGQTTVVTFTFSEAVSGFALSDASVSGGALSNLTHVGLNGSSQDVYTATFTPSAADTEAGSVQVNALSYADAAGNSGASSNIVSFTGDTLAPTVSVSADHSTLLAGQTAAVTFTFSEAVSGFALGDASVSGGALSNLVHVGVNGSQQDIYTATFTPSAANAEVGSVQVNAASYTDVSGNNGAASNTVSFTGDTLSPTVSVSADHTTLLAGQTAVVTFTFSEAVSSFAASDISVSGGALSNLTHIGLNGSSQDVYTATFTPGATNTEAGAVQVNALSYTDAAGNSGAASNTINFTGDTLAPTVSVSVDHSTLLAGQTAAVTFAFSEAVANFAFADVMTSGGALSNLIHVGLDGLHHDIYTATFTPDVTDTLAGAVQVKVASYTDAAGNNGAASNTVGFTGDTKAPSAPTLALANDTGAADGVTSDPHIIYTKADGADTLLYKADGALVFSTTAPNFITDGLHTVSVAEVDAAGNIGAVSSLSFTLDTVVPQPVAYAGPPMAGNSPPAYPGPTVTLPFTGGGSPPSIPNGGDATVYNPPPSAWLGDAFKFAFADPLPPAHAPADPWAGTGLFSNGATVNDLSGNHAYPAIDAGYTSGLPFSGLGPPVSSDYHLF